MKKFVLDTSVIVKWFSKDDAAAEHEKNHFGIIVSNQIPFSELLKRTIRFHSSNTRNSIRNNIIWLQDYK